MISIGIDQSTTKTGLCIGEFDRNGWHKIAKAITVETHNYIAMRDELIKLTNWLDMRIQVVIAEGAFYGRSATAHANAVRSATWVECVVLQYGIGELFDIVGASEWRAKVWPGPYQVECDGGCESGIIKKYNGMTATCPTCKGTGFVPKKMLSADWKAHGIAEAVKDGIVDPDDHQGDARGLMLYGIKLWLEGKHGLNETEQ